jgi:2-isopropylmalate synthase
VQAITDLRGGELTPAELLVVFNDQYLAHTRPYELVGYTHTAGASIDSIAAELLVDGVTHTVEGSGNGPIAALVDALERGFGVAVEVRDYHEHAMSASAEATAAAYVEADVGGDLVWGVGVHPSIVTASLNAVINAVNRALALRRALAGAAAAFD